MSDLDTAGFIFVFKQKTAYELRISDWSSDVCSSDLSERGYDHTAAAGIDRAELDRSGKRKQWQRVERKAGRRRGQVAIERIRNRPRHRAESAGRSLGQAHQPVHRRRSVATAPVRACVMVGAPGVQQAAARLCALDQSRKS